MNPYDNKGFIEENNDKNGAVVPVAADKKNGPAVLTIDDQKNGHKDMKFADNINKAVIQLKDVNFGYGKDVMILKGITMTVNGGTIYGLLGASGCGKTTTLRLILGLLEPSSGTTLVLGQRPGAVPGLIPGNGVGYMPQEIALYNYLTIDESLYYFAKLNHVDKEEVHSRIVELTKLLHLPDGEKLVSNLSGGQRRRVSLAVTLLHEPPILILDEPTVGVDPLLRENIWDHLKNVCIKKGQTIIITTHYLEEAKTSDRIGLMRSGKLLIEDEPQTILDQMNCVTVEEAFLKLSHDNEIEIEKEMAMKGDGALKEVSTKESKKNVAVEKMEKINDHYKFYSAESIATLGALLWKNLIIMRRNLIMLLFQFFFPAFEVIILCLFLGVDPKDISVAIYNPDTSSASLTLLNSIDSEVIYQQHYPTLSDAIQSVKDGDAWAVIQIPNNYSELVKNQQLQICLDDDIDWGSDSEVEDDSLVKKRNLTGQINLYMDNTNEIIGGLIQKELYDAIQIASTLTKKSYGVSESTLALLRPPIEIHDPPIYGRKKAQPRDVLYPGIVISLLFITGLSSTTLVLINERTDALLERSLAAGIKSYHFVLSHLITQILILFVQIFLTLVLSFQMTDIPTQGSITLVYLLVLFQGICGISFGLLISAFAKDVNQGIIIAMSAFFPVSAMSGTFWPPQAMPKFILWTSYVLPLTLPGEAMRGILLRGWGLSSFLVLLGYGVTFAWILVFFASAIVLFKKTI